MARKLHLKTYKNWEHLDQYRGPKWVEEEGKWGEELVGGEERDITIHYYGKAYTIGYGAGVGHPNWQAQSYDDVLGVFQGVWHGPGPARKATRKFYILEKSGDPDRLVGHRTVRYLLWETTLSKSATGPKYITHPPHRYEPTDAAVEAHQIASLSSDGLKRKFGKKSEDWTYQHLATKMFEASKK